MMRSRAIHLPFRILGFPVVLDPSFLLVLPLFAYLIGSQIPAYVTQLASLGVDVDPAPLQRGATPYLLGLVAAIGLFTSVLIHEVGHAVVARRYGVKVKEIRLWFLGGVAQFEEMPRQRGAEAVVAIVGPLTSIAVGALAWGAMQLVEGGAGLVLLSYLAVTNIGLAVFNLLPALPLDGGRVLRSLLSLAMPHLRATGIAVSVSGALAILLGVYGFVTTQLFLVILAFFVYNAGRAEGQAAIVESAVGNRTVADLMTPDPITVEPEMRLDQFLQLLHFRRHTGYPVVDRSGRLLGYARLADAQAAMAQAEEAGPDAEPDTVATIVQDGETIAPHESAMTALRRVAAGDLGRLLVIDDAGHLVGVVSKTDLLALIQEASGRQEATRNQDRGV
ncbi:MAG: site-2 protease family protein [Trueperaceae bacterium]